MSIDDENAKLRALLRRMREEADEAWRNGEPRSMLAVGARRDHALFQEAAELLGPSEWEALTPTKHILWGDKAICHWTLHPPKKWPSTQTFIEISELIVQLPDPTDPTHIEFVARPERDWNGVTCDDCRIRLPALLAGLDVILDDIHEGIMEGFRTHPDTLRDTERYEREVAHSRSPEARRRDAAIAEQVRAQTAMRAARRARRSQR